MSPTLSPGQYFEPINTNIDKRLNRQPNVVSKNINLLTPIFAPKTWGNNQAIIDFLGKDPGFKETIGEIFLASGLADDEGGSTLINGTSLRTIFNDRSRRVEWFGELFENADEFPILLKILAIKEPLSLQVHPGDELLGNKRIPGKTEGWYALSDSSVLCGFKEHFTEKDMKALIAEGFFDKKHSIKELEKYLQRIDLKKGEALYVESGTIHTILSGELLEPQQPNNTTYRIYDWGHNIASRPLHLDKALKVLNYSSRPQKLQGNAVFFDKSYFKVERITVKDGTTVSLELDRFHLVLPLKNELMVNEDTIPGGQAAFIPANTAQIKLQAKRPTDVFVITPKV